MRVFCILTVFVTFGCLQTESPTFTEPSAVKGTSTVILENLVYIDMLAPSYTTQHILVGRSVGGRDMAFRHIQSGETIHAVFPKGMSAPDELNGHFKLYGYYQTLPRVKQEKEARVVKKRIPNDYRYFTVSSWEHKK